MKIELDSLQLVGVWFMMSGLFLHSIIFLVAYVKIATHLSPDNDDDDNDDDDNEEKKGFPIVRFAIKIRKVIKVVMSEKKREEYKRIFSIIDWTIVSAFAMTILGFLLILLGTLL